MKKEMTLRTTDVRVQKYAVSSQPFSLSAVKKRVLKSMWLHTMSGFYTRLLEMPVTPLQGLHLLHAQLAFLLMIFPADFSLPVRFLFIAWFGLALLQCRRAGLK